MDAHLLLGKLHYACGQYPEALKNYKMADLQNLSEKKLPLYVVLSSCKWLFFNKQLADVVWKLWLSHMLLKASAYRKTPHPPANLKRLRKKRRHLDVLIWHLIWVCCTCKIWKRKSILVLLWAQGLQVRTLRINKKVFILVIPGSHSPQPPGQQKTLGDVLEQAIQAAPLSLLQQGKANQALERYRFVKSWRAYSTLLKFLK